MIPCSVTADLNRHHMAEIHAIGPTEEEIEASKKRLIEAITLDCQRGHYGADWLMNWSDDHLVVIPAMLTSLASESCDQGAGWACRFIRDAAIEKFAEQIIERFSESNFQHFADNDEERRQIIRDILE